MADAFAGFDYEKAGKEFQMELDSGRFSIERLGNNGQDYEEMKADRDLAAFGGYLDSEDYQALNAEASR